jgi:hypothetical protein
MEKSKYNQMIHAQEQAHNNAWAYIFSVWTCNEWKSLPQQIKATLNLHPQVGVCGGMLITRNSAMGINDFIARMNRKRG